LLDRGIIKEFSDFFRLLEGANLNMVFPHPSIVIDAVHQSGGKVFLAHPSSNQKGGLDEKVLDDFRLWGIDGLECYSPYSKDADEIQYYLDYCTRYDLKISGGSDYHGKFVNRHLGEPHVEEHMISYDFFSKLAIKGE